LVKDGAAAIRTALGGVDTSFVDLKGGTTGQVLSKASGTDLDFSWVAQDDSNAIQNAIVDAKGDLIAATAADTPARLAIGTNGQILTADSAESTGMKWATPASSGGMTLISTTSMTSSSTVTVSIPSGYTNLMVEVIDWYINGNDAIYFRLNGATGAQYRNVGVTYQGSVAPYFYAETYTDGKVSLMNSACTQAQNNQTSLINLYNISDTNTVKIYNYGSRFNNTNGQSFAYGNGAYTLAEALTSISIIAGAGSYQAGTIKVWGIK
jgi:hypothetical protein